MTGILCDRERLPPVPAALITKATKRGDEATWFVAFVVKAMH
jgi:hypothetical protein